MRIKHSKKPSGQYPEIAQRFKEARLNARLTQAEFAKVIGLSPAAVGAIENGAYTPNFSVMRMMRKRLNISYEHLIDGDESSVSDRLKEMEADLKRLTNENNRLKKVVDKLVK